MKNYQEIRSRVNAAIRDLDRKGYTFDEKKAFWQGVFKDAGIQIKLDV